MKRRVACIDLPELPLQLLLRDRPAMRRGPAAVVADDRPEAPLVHLNADARRARLRTGMRYGAARDLVPTLRAGVVPEERLQEAMAELVSALQTFSPRVEPDAERPGVLWADPSGLERIYGGVRTWARSVRAYLRARDLRSTVAVGFGRFSSFCLARGAAGAGVLVVRDEAEERALLEAVRLDAIGVSPGLRDELGLLGVHRVGDLVGLPSSALRARFGAEASRLSELASDEQLPVQPSPFGEPTKVALEIDPPDADHARLLFGIKGALHELLRQVSAEARSVLALRLELALESGQVHTERIEPAAPTRDAMLLLDLVRLRLGDVALGAPVSAVSLEAETTAPSGEQLALFPSEQRRDRPAAGRALARVRAAFGPRSVTRARLRDAHLPEAGFAWEPLAELPRPRRAPVPAPEAPPLVRRVLPRPRPLPARDAARPDAGPFVGDGDRALVRLYGPYRVSGGWWVRTVERDYYYAETGRGDLLWLFYDRPRHKWFLHGVVD